MSVQRFYRGHMYFYYSPLCSIKVCTVNVKRCSFSCDDNILQALPGPMAINTLQSAIGTIPYIYKGDTINPVLLKRPLVVLLGCPHRLYQLACTLRAHSN